MKKRILFLLLFYLISLPAYSQTVYEPLYKDVYLFLARSAQKGLIELDDIIKPLSKKYIFEKLNELNNKQVSLPALQQKELEFYLKDYELENVITKEAEGKSWSFLKKDDGKRLNLFTYKDKLFKLNFNPILGIKLQKIESELNKHFWSGVYFYGYLGDNLGFSFDYRDNAETGKYIDIKKNFSPETGINASVRNLEKIEYKEISTTLSYDWSWGNISLGKGFLEWGYGKSGKIVLSDKAPSFPFIRLDIKPVNWLSFNYFHGWLNSSIIDSAESYLTGNTGGLTNRLIYRNKYIASHTLTLNINYLLNLNPEYSISFSIGESIIYSDKLKIAYLMPLMFFKLADMYLSEEDNSVGDNSQFFGNINIRNLIPNTHIYTSLFVDEIITDKIFSKDKSKSQIGFTFGSSVTDFPIDNLTLSAEYTRVNPFVYSHFIPTLTYTSSRYLLGHWIGNNADIIYGELNYRIIRSLQGTIWWQYIRKGETGTVEQQYKVPQPDFLFGKMSNFTFAGIDIKYEYIHDLLAKLSYQYSNISDQEVTRTPIWQLGKNHSFSLSLYYGL